MGISIMGLLVMFWKNQEVWHVYLAIVVHVLRWYLFNWELAVLPRVLSLLQMVVDVVHRGARYIPWA
jgi:hypothetical protein